MRVEIKIDETVTEPKVVIVTDRLTDEINELARRFGGEGSDVLVGYKNGVAEILDECEIIRVYATAGKVFAECESGEYTLRGRLYEWEERLGGKFVRISKSEIVNLKKVKGFDMSFSGTVAVKLKNGKTTYISRRYISKVKQILGI